MAGRKKDKNGSFEEPAALPFAVRPAAPPRGFPFADYESPAFAPRGREAGAGSFKRSAPAEPPAAAKNAAVEKALSVAEAALKAAAEAAAGAAAAPAEAIPLSQLSGSAPGPCSGESEGRAGGTEAGGLKPACPAAPAAAENIPAAAGKVRDARQTAPGAAAAKPAAPPKPKLHYEGHRQRLRERFLKGGGRDMADYEFLELLLFRSVPRRDTKPLAKALLARFGSLNGVFAADMQHLTEINGCGEAVAADLKIIGAATKRALYSEVAKRNVFQSWDRLIAYCRSAMAFEQREQFRILFLDKKNGLIREEILQTGTVDHTPVYPRDVVKRALDNAASAIILVHNHPSGDPTPSRQDILMTKQLEQLLSGMNIAIHDHLIIGRNGYSSFRELELL